MADMRDCLAEFGADLSALRLLDHLHEGPELLPYATLVMECRYGDATLDVIEAVYEWQDAPLMFVVDADSLECDDQLRQVRRLLAMRGDAPYLGVVAPGSLKVYRIALDSKRLRQVRVDLGDGKGTRSTVFPLLCNERPDAARTNRGWISNVVLRLLDGSMTKLINDCDVSREDAISLVGRALFTRFLGDRNLLDGIFPLAESGSQSDMVASLFDNPYRAKNTSEWLDEKFNGDLLPLSAGIFEELPEEGYNVLGDILRRAPDGQLLLGWEEKWDNLDFAHIPVGVLSQAYELYLRKHEPSRQKHEGGFFTPRPIAELMVRASFRAFGRRGTGKSARVLDPAVGGGIFLLTAFRELVAEHWRADGERPDTDTLRQILYEQVVGFDVNEAALRFTALGLYLLSIELDPEPRPVDKLGFKCLRGAVLHRVVGEEEKESEALGSLGPLVGEEHNGQYDLVIGNPPWARGTQLPKWNRVRKTVARIAARREIATNSPPLPNKVLDLPFVWRAMEWTKPGGQIAFALHARLLFHQGNGMPIARQALFEALDVTSVVNGVELRQTNVWPQVSAPFCILFATNRKPGVEAGFRFISPRIENSLNRSGCMRIDAVNAEIVPTRQLVDTPDILKILFRGSKLDLRIIQRIRALHPTLHKFWSEKIGTAKRKRLRGSGNGYQTLKKSSRIRKKGDGRPGVDASYLHGLPKITASSFANVNVLVDTPVLHPFSHERIHDPRAVDLFAGPQVIVKESPSASAGRIGVVVSDQGTVFKQTFYGYSPGDYSDAALLVRYLALVLGSKLIFWLALVTSGKFGFERDTIEKATLDRIPIPDFEELTSQQRKDIENLIKGLHSESKSWEEVDEWVACLYGLSQRDLQVISDTLEFNLPLSENKKNAQEAPSATDTARFCEILKDELMPWCDRFGSKLAVDQMPLIASSPWQAIAVRTGRHEPMDTVPEGDWAGLVRAADEVAASEILMENGSNALLICRLTQKRYWSETQARLLAQRIGWSHVELLKGHVNA